MRIVVQVKELVSSNVTAMVETASNPVKMLRLLRKEIEESDIALHAEIGKLERQQTRAGDEAKRLDAEARDWSEKAKIAMDHDREDLARSALLAREDAKQRAANKRSEAADLKANIAEAQDTLELLSAKLDETNARLKEQVARADGEAGSSNSSADSKTDKRLDRISNLERRVGFAMGVQPPAPKSNASVDAEIAEMQRERTVDAELEKLRKSASGKKKAGGRRKAS